MPGEVAGGVENDPFPAERMVEAQLAGMKKQRGALHRLAVEIVAQDGVTKAGLI
jgi:hypothetical protein